MQEDSIVRVRGKLELHLRAGEFDANRSQGLNRILRQFPGRDGVCLLVSQADGRNFRAELPITVDARSPVMRNELNQLFGRAV